MAPTTIGLIARTGAVILLLIAPASAQRHLPYLQVFSSAVPLLLDTRVEQPAVYNGNAQASLPRVGETLEFQLFVPSAAGKAVFEYTIEFDNSGNAFSGSFRIVSAVDWLGRSLAPLPGSTGAVRSTIRADLAVLPPGGHVLTIALAPRGQLTGRVPLKLEISVTVVSDPPRRVWQMRGRQVLRWM